MCSINIHFDESVEAMAARFVDAWHRAERGDVVDERHLSFESWAGLSRVRSGRRLELLRHLRHHPAASIAALARALQRDYKRVHEDVEALVAAGLMLRDEAGLRIGYDQIRTSISM